jgi:hypothetical protein
MKPTKEALILSLKETTLRRLRQGVTFGAVAAAGTQGVVACVGDVISTEGTGAAQLGQGHLSDEQDWAQKQGRRDPEMVRPFGEVWSVCASPYSRGGCGQMDVFVKIMIKAMPDADWEKKRVGIVYRTTIGNGQVIADHHSNLADGFEEWHARVRMPVWEMPGFVFNAWYQPGTGDNTTYFDDNDGELHAAMFRPQDSVVRIDYTVPTEERVRIDDHGIHGRIRAYVADIDQTKELELHFSTDEWRTTQSFLISDDPDQPNTWHWVRDAFTGFDMYEINVDLPHPQDGARYTKFWYAIRYTHGTGGVERTRRYDFWANNSGYDFKVEAQPLQPLPQAAPPVASGGDEQQ